MHEGVESNWQANYPLEDKVRSTAATRLALPIRVYDLRDDGGNSDEFYSKIAEFATRIVARIETRIGPILDGYCHDPRICNKEAERSRDEYVIEFLTLGMALKRYEGAAKETSGSILRVAELLLWIRRNVPLLKVGADWLRARLSPFLLSDRAQNNWESETLNQASDHQTETPSTRLSKLVRWLRSTGEYEQEASRIDNWRKYLRTLTSDGARQCIAAAVSSFEDFAHQSESELRVYTAGVNRFLLGEYAQRGPREDHIFCGRPPVEYHLNMVAMHVMNRGLQETFELTTRRVVLVPVCMRRRKDESCKARLSGLDLTCMACDPDCNVNRITRRMRGLGAEVHIVRHSTGFSQWLDRWRREPGVGVTAVACMLNILPGGYEMRTRRIASQCVPLDYPGCKKHWDSRGLATSVNEERLVQIATRLGPGHLGAGGPS